MTLFDHFVMGLPDRLQVWPVEARFQRSLATPEARDDCISSFWRSSRPRRRRAPCRSNIPAGARLADSQAGRGGGVEAVAVSRKHASVLVNVAAGERKLSLQQFLHLPLRRALVSADAPQLARAPVSDEIIAVHVRIVGHSEAEYGAAPARRLFRTTRIGSLVWIISDWRTPTLRHWVSGPVIGKQWAPAFSFQP